MFHYTSCVYQVWWFCEHAQKVLCGQETFKSDNEDEVWCASAIKQQIAGFYYYKSGCIWIDPLFYGLWRWRDDIDGLPMMLDSMCVVTVMIQLKHILSQHKITWFHIKCTLILIVCYPWVKECYMPFLQEHFSPSHTFLVELLWHKNPGCAWARLWAAMWPKGCFKQVWELLNLRAHQFHLGIKYTFPYDLISWRILKGTVEISYNISYPWIEKNICFSIMQILATI